jgi:hypothetical protein
MHRVFNKLVHATAFGALALLVALAGVGCLRCSAPDRPSAGQA